MYFQFIKFCLIIGVVIFLASGVHNLSANTEGAACLNSTAEYDDYLYQDNDTSTMLFSYWTQLQDANAHTTTVTDEDAGTHTAHTTSADGKTTVTTTTAANDDGSTTTTTTTTTDQETYNEASTEQNKNEGIIDDELCPPNQINRLSLANIANEPEELEKADIYNFFTIVVLLLIMQFIRKIQKQTAVICDEREITASDYTVRVTNLPRDFDQTVDIDEVIKQFFIENGLPGTRLNVQNVSVCYDASERYAIERKMAKTIETRAKLKARKNTKKELVSDDEIASLKTEIQGYKDQLTAISRKFQEGVGVSKQFEGEAYVTFETQRG